MITESVKIRRMGIAYQNTRLPILSASSVFPWWFSVLAHYLLTPSD